MRSTPSIDMMDLDEDNANSHGILITLMSYQGTERKVTEQALVKFVKEPKGILEKNPSR